MDEDRHMVPLAVCEPADIGERFIWGLTTGCLGLLLVCSLLVLWLYPRASLDRTLDQPLPAYPAPQLQSDPAADMIEFRQREMQRLESLGWIDRDQRIVHIPIALAMQKLAQEGIPEWPAGQTRAAPPDLAPAQIPLGRHSP